MVGWLGWEAIGAWVFMRSMRVISEAGLGKADGDGTVLSLEN